MATLDWIKISKGQQLTDAHIASMARGDFGYHVISGCDVNQSETPGMSVVVDSGYVQLGYSHAQTAVGSTTVVIATADVTYPRMDVIYINTSGIPSVYAGTPTAISPSSKTNFKEMATPAPGTSIPSGIPIALVYVGAGVTSITNSVIWDIGSHGGYFVEAPTTTTSGKVPYWSSTAKTLTDGYTVGTSASNLVQLDGSARLPAVSGYNLTNTATTAVLTTVGDTLARGASGLTRIAKGTTGQAYLQGASTPTWTTRTFDVAFPFGDGINVMYAGSQSIRIPIGATIVAARIRSFDSTGALVSGSVTCSLYRHAINGTIGSAIDSFVVSSTNYYQETGLSLAVTAGYWLTVITSSITSCKQIVLSLTLEAT